MDRLIGFAELFEKGSKDGLLPLCGALAAEMAALPESLQALAKRSFSLELQWLTQVIDAAKSAGQIPGGRHTTQQAYQILSLLEGNCFIESAMKDGLNIDHTVFKFILAIP